MAITKVNTATLIRGQLYTFRHPDSTPQNPIDSLRFEAGKPVIIEDTKVLQMLEDMEDEVGDGDGEFYLKPVFRIQRGVEAPEGSERKRPIKLSADRTIRKKRIAR